MEIKIGKYKSKDICVDCDNLFNQHIGILGESGSGKTVQAQYILQQLANQGQVVLALDSRGILSEDQIFEPYRNSFTPLIHNIDVKEQGFPIDIFESMMYEDGSYETTKDIVGAVVEMLSRPFKFGDRQKAALRRAVEGVMETGACEEGISSVGDVLREMTSSSAMAVRERLYTLTNNNIFRPNGKLFQQGKITIIRLNKFDLDTQQMLSEIFIAYLWRLAVMGHFKKQPIFLFVDECHNMSSGKNSTLAQMLSEGRKFGVNLILITQMLTSSNTSAVQQRFSQAGLMLYFKPANTQLDSTAKLINPSSKEEWIPVLRKLKKGEFIATGAFLVDGCKMDIPLKVCNRVDNVETTKIQQYAVYSSPKEG